MAERGQLPAHRLEAGEELPVFDKRDRGLAVTRDVGHLLGRERVVEADGDAPREEDAEVGDHMLGPVPGHDHREAAGLDSQRPQAIGHLADAIPVFAPGEGMPARLGAPVQGRLAGMCADRVQEGAEHRAPGDQALQLGPFRLYPASDL